MAARAVWKGVVRLPGVEVPVKLYSAVASAHAVHFRLLHGKDLTPVQARMVHPRTGRAVAHEDTRRGYVTGDGRLVVLDEEDLSELEPEESRDIEVLRFVPAGAVDPRWYERPYYLGPDGDDEGWSALAAALEKRAVEGVCRWVMRRKEYLGALRVEQGRPVLVTLRHAGEVVDASALPRPQGRAMGTKEVAMARQLLAALEGEFDPKEWRDEHRERLMELIRAKAEGKTIPLAKYREREPAEDLAAVLKRSLAAVKRSA